MKTLKSALAVAGVTVAAVFAFAAPAQAGGHGDGNKQHSSGNVGLLNGNQVQLPVNVGLNACGNGIAILGLAGGYGNCGNKFH